MMRRLATFVVTPTAKAHRSLRLAALSLALLAGGFLAPAVAQTHRVEPPQKVTRAVAVYEWTGDFAKPDAARLVPVSLFINGHLEDAGVFLARPVPFALQSGNVYFVEQAGELKGTLDVDHARDVVTHRSADDDAPVSTWFGYGNVTPPAPPQKAPVLHASKNPSTITGSNDPDRPTLSKSQTPGSKSSDASKPTSAPAADADPDRPHMNRRSDTSTTADSTTPAASTGSVPDTDPDRPTLRKRDPKEDAARRKADSASSVTPMANSLNDDASRPTMRRGKPPGMTAAPELTSLPPTLHQIAAVSDAVTRPPHVFSREWASPTERAETLAAFEAIARPRILSYIQTYRLSSTTPATAATPVPLAAPARPAKAHGRSGKPAPPAGPALALDNEQLAPYTLIYDGLPTFVYTAEAPLTSGGPIYLTLVAQRLPSGELQVALSSITDAGHLNRSPWLRLIDAVDPTASHRASLLFELRAQSTRQFALYDLVTARAEQRFVTGVIQ